MSIWQEPDAGRVVAELKAVIERARTATPTAEAMEFHKEREAALALPGVDPYDLTSPVTLIGDAIVDRAEALEKEHGDAVARAFADVAVGRTTPLIQLVGALAGRWCCGRWVTQATDPAATPKDGQ